MLGMLLHHGIAENQPGFSVTVYIKTMTHESDISFSKSFEFNECYIYWIQSRDRFPVLCELPKFSQKNPETLLNTLCAKRIQGFNTHNRKLSTFLSFSERDNASENSQGPILRKQTLKSLSQMSRSRQPFAIRIQKDTMTIVWSSVGGESHVRDQAGLHDSRNPRFVKSGLSSDITAPAPCLVSAAPPASVPEPPFRNVPEDASFEDFFQFGGTDEAWGCDSFEEMWLA
jgi:hypothetical protein